jgi:hypothetical protein
MKKVLLSMFTILSFMATSQEEKTEEKKTQEEKKENESDTTKISFKKKDVYIVDKVIKDSDTIDASPDKPDHDGHWAGIDFGPSILLNSIGGSSFPIDPQWQNDPSKSFYWNINVFEHKFNIYKHYFGITTGLGINFTQIGIKNNQILLENSDSIWVVKDTVNQFKKNKLRATYLQIPLLLEFNTNEDADHSFYFATGVIGGINVASAYIQQVGKAKEKQRGNYGFNPFKLDATVRLGYGDWGVFANYALMPLLDTSKTSEVYPFTFGATFNF